MACGLASMCCLCGDGFFYGLGTHSIIVLVLFPDDSVPVCGCTIGSGDHGMGMADPRH